MSAVRPLTSDEASLLIDALTGVVRELRRSYDATAAELGLTFSRTRILTALIRHEGVTQADLVQTLGVEAPTLKRQIDALERGGFVERRSLDNDARKRALFPTEKTRSSKLTSFVAATRSELVKGVTPEEALLVSDVLARMTVNAAGLMRDDT